MSPMARFRPTDHANRSRAVFGNVNLPDTLPFPDPWMARNHQNICKAVKACEADDWQEFFQQEEVLCLYRNAATITKSVPGRLLEEQTRRCAERGHWHLHLIARAQRPVSEIDAHHHQALVGYPPGCWCMQHFYAGNGMARVLPLPCFVGLVDSIPPWRRTRELS